MIAAWCRMTGWLMAVEETPGKLAKKLGIDIETVRAALANSRGKTNTTAIDTRQGGYTIKRIAR